MLRIGESPLYRSIVIYYLVCFERLSRHKQIFRSISKLCTIGVDHRARAQERGMSVTREYVPLRRANSKNIPSILCWIVPGNCGGGEACYISRKRVRIFHSNVVVAHPIRPRQNRGAGLGRPIARQRSLMKSSMSAGVMFRRLTADPCRVYIYTNVVCTHNARLPHRQRW
jgi:hypothetical protein